MAQLVERVLGKDEVAGSNPASSSRKEVDFSQLLFFFLQTYEPSTKVAIRTLDRLAIPSLRSLQIRLVAPEKKLI